MMRGIFNRNFSTATAALVLAAACAMLSCASAPPPIPGLTAADAGALVLQRWSKDELNHFTVSLHSDTLIACGLQHDLWKLAELSDRNGVAFTTQYQLTGTGSQALTAIDLNRSGKAHAIMLKGPYRIEITGIADGNQPTAKKVTFRWDVDWDKAPDGLKACVPRYELTGHEEALFEFDGSAWRFLSYSKYINPDDAQAPPAETPVFDKLHQ